MATSRTTAPAPTLRARRRAAATEEIKALARRQLAEHGLLYQAHVQAIALGMGYRSGDVEQAAGNGS